MRKLIVIVDRNSGGDQKVTIYSNSEPEAGHEPEPGWKMVARFPLEGRDAQAIEPLLRIIRTADGANEGRRLEDALHTLLLAVMGPLQ